MTVRVGLGSGMGPELSIQDYWRWVDLCETSGIDSLWYSDQLLGASMEPLSLLAGLAARTERMRIGTSALVIAFRDPIVVAKALAAIDFISNGRLLPVFGVGNASDAYWAATGTSPGGRGSRSNEAIELVRLLLEEEQVDYEGSHYSYRGPGVFPRPAKPVPLWIGGNADAALNRTARLGDGWLGSMVGPDRAAEARLRIETELEETGRSIDSDHFGMTLMMRIGAPDEPAVAKVRQRIAKNLPDAAGMAAQDMLAVGSPEDVITKLQRYVAAGMSKFVLIPISNGIDDLLDQTERLAREVLPVVEGRG